MDSNLENLILNIPKFQITRFENGEYLYNYVHFKHKQEYLCLDILNKFYDDLKKQDNFLVLRNGKIIYKPTNLPYDLIQCSDCGNIWDGNAQCTCYLYDLCYY